MLTATRVRNRFQWQLLAATAMPWAVLLVLGAADLPHSVGATALLTGALGTPHVATTFLFYGDGEMRDHLRAHPLRYLIAPAALVVGGAAWGFAAPDLVLQAGIVGLVVWQLHHFTRQNLGVFSFVCRSRGVPGPSDRERQAIKLTGYAAMLGIATEIHPLGVDIPGAALLGHLGLVVLVAAIVFAARPASDDPVRRMMMVLCLAFYAPLFFSANLGAVIVAYGSAHGAQYYVMMLHMSAGREQRVARRMFAAVPLLALVVGWPLLRMGSVEPGIIFGVYSGVVASHFVIDAGVWRLRDAQQRAYMKRRFAFL